MTSETPKPNNFGETLSDEQRKTLAANCDELLENPDAFSKGKFNQYVDLMIEILGIDERSLGGFSSNHFAFTDNDTGLEGLMSFDVNSLNKRSVNLTYTHPSYEHSEFDLDESISLVSDPFLSENDDFAFLKSSLTSRSKFKSLAKNDPVVFDKPSETIGVLSKKQTHTLLLKTLGFYKTHEEALRAIKSPQEP